MPLWLCVTAHCQQPAVRTLGDCIICDHHFCATHAAAATHTCPKWEDAEAYDPAARNAEKNEINRLLGRIDCAALAERASVLRGGTSCTIPTAEYIRAERSSVMGGMNYHLEIQFVDGVVWLARIRRFNASSPPPAMRDYIIRSEYATYKFLEKTKVPAPRVFDFALEGRDNPVGVGYMLIEKLPGKSLRWSLLEAEQQSSIIGQLADIYIELSKYPFDKMGCLFEDSPYYIGGFARESLMDLEGENLLTLGPYHSPRDYHSNSIQLILDLILRDELHTDRPIDAYLIHLFVRDLIPKITSHGGDSGPFFLKHADDKGDHLLVDEEGHITGIIDWEWAHTAPAELAFNSPLLLLPVAEFYDGINTLGEQEVELAQLFERNRHNDLAEIVRRGRIQHRFAFCCGYDLADWDGFLGLFRGLRDLVDVDAGLDWEDWKQVALTRYADDLGLKELQEPSVC